jgi:5,10-methylene-tetrahydrofolate dehydrogenase/methenyl tetrahydrofolate cyclohydrolase
VIAVERLAGAGSIDGPAHAERLRTHDVSDVREHRLRHDAMPGLAVVLVRDRARIGTASRPMQFDRSLRSTEWPGAVEVEMEGRAAVVVGASNIVGEPTEVRPMRRDEVVCIRHQKTRDLVQATLLAEFLLVAPRMPNVILAPMDAPVPS